MPAARGVSLLPLLFSLVGARPGSATLVCTPAAFDTCASVTISTAYDVDAHGNVVTVLIMTTHVQSGSIGYSSFGGQIFDGGTDSHPDDLLSWDIYTQGPVISPPGCPPGSYCDRTDAGWEAWPIDPNADPTDPTLPLHHRFEQYAHILACTPWAEEFLTQTFGFGLATCGTTGALVFRLRLTGRWEPNQVAFWVNNGADCLAINGQIQPHYAYTAAAKCAVTSTTVTPEPATWTLLGTGLVGLSIAARRRGRRR